LKIYVVLNNHYNSPFHKSSSKEDMRIAKLAYKEPELNWELLFSEKSSVPENTK
jgi:hypothetical protein